MDLKWQKPFTRWLHVFNLSANILEILSPALNLHAVAVDDALHYPQRPAMEVFDHNLFIVLQVS